MGESQQQEVLETEEVVIGQSSQESTGKHKKGKEALFARDPREEVKRILRVQKNYYEVLKVKTDTPVTDIRHNYLRLSRLVHPDKCSHPQAGEATAVLTQAYNTLSNQFKKALYDRYTTEQQVLYMTEDEEMTKVELGGAELPRWVAILLSCPGGAMLAMLIFFPLMIILLIIFFFLWLLCLPVSILFCFFQNKTNQQENSQRMLQDAQSEESQVQHQSQSPQHSQHGFSVV